MCAHTVCQLRKFMSRASIQYRPTFNKTLQTHIQLDGQLRTKQETSEKLHHGNHIYIYNGCTL